MANFGHIYYDNWIIGKSYQKKLKNGNIIDLGILVSKKLDGRPYDPDMFLTFTNNGIIYEHIVDFDNSYRLTYLD